MANQKYRGAQTHLFPSSNNIQELISYGANFIRYQMWVWENYSDGRWLGRILDYLTHLDTQILPCITNQKIVLDIHMCPGGYSGDFWNNKDMQELFYQTWEIIAFRYKDNPKIYGYGILNEPKASRKEVAGLMQKAGERIRKIDSKKMIMITTKGSGISEFNYLKKSNLKNVYYEVHMYKPMEFTHQGTLNYPEVGKVYPTKNVNKAKLKSWLKPVRDFQLRTNGQIYVGEFSASIYADPVSRSNYLRDVISICKEYSWQWTYHCWEPKHGGEVWDPRTSPLVLSTLVQGFQGKIK